MQGVAGAFAVRVDPHFQGSACLCVPVRGAGTRYLMGVERGGMAGWSMEGAILLGFNAPEKDGRHPVGVDLPPAHSSVER